MFPLPAAAAAAVRGKPWATQKTATWGPAHQMLGRLTCRPAAAVQAVKRPALAYAAIRPGGNKRPK